MTNRAYSVLSVKAYDDEKREITGMATTPTPDRMQDIVEPMGVKFGESIPLLLHHDHRLPVGSVKFGKPTKEGIPFTAYLPKIEEEGTVKDRVDEAWHSVKYKLIGAVSIGFRVLNDAVEMLKTGGIRFLETELYELSLVTVPANADAIINTIKSYDQHANAALGKSKPVVKMMQNPVGVTTKTPKVTNKVKDMNISDQIKGFEATRQAKMAAMAAIMEKAGDEGRTLDESEAQEYDELQGEVKAADDHLARLRTMEKQQIATAVPVQGKSVTASSDSRAPATAKITQKLDKGIEFARYVMCLGAAKGDLNTAKAIAQNRFPENERINHVLKAAVEAGTTTDATWAAPLVEYNQFAGDFVEFLRPQTIIGKFGVGGMPALRSIPFNVHVRGQTSGGEGYWVGQGAPKPLTQFDFNDAYLGFTKVANIAVLTQELMRFSNPSAERLVRDSLAEALIARLDIDFIDPDKAAVSNVSPASITNGVTAIPASGTGDADDIRTDVAAAMGTFIAANITPASGVWIMSATTALSLSLMRNALGQKEFPEINMMGGMFEGLPVIVSEYVGGDSSGRYVILANASDIWLADDGQVMIDASREASLQMLDNPTNNSGTATPTTMVSMFQTNSVAIRAERYINWKKRRAAAVTYISGVNWGA